jgi:hypothetical protein
MTSTLLRIGTSRIGRDPIPSSPSHAPTAGLARSWGQSAWRGTFYIPARPYRTEREPPAPSRRQWRTWRPHLREDGLFRSLPGRLDCRTSEPAQNRVRRASFPSPVCSQSGQLSPTVSFLDRESRGPSARPREGRVMGIANPVGLATRCTTCRRLPRMSQM